MTHRALDLNLIAQMAQMIDRDTLNDNLAADGASEEVETIDLALERIQREAQPVRFPYTLALTEAERDAVIHGLRRYAKDVREGRAITNLSRDSKVEQVSHVNNVLWLLETPLMERLPSAPVEGAIVFYVFRGGIYIDTLGKHWGLKTEGEAVEKYRALHPEIAADSIEVSRHAPTFPRDAELKAERQRG